MRCGSRTILVTNHRDLLGWEIIHVAPYKGDIKRVTLQDERGVRVVLCPEHFLKIAQNIQAREKCLELKRRLNPLPPPSPPRKLGPTRQKILVTDEE